MKYLLLIGLLLGVFWLLRQQRGRAKSKAAAPPARPSAVAPPTEIIECARCTVHLPRAEAVAGQRGLYCCAAHQREAEGG